MSWGDSLYDFVCNLIRSHFQIVSRLPRANLGAMAMPTSPTYPIFQGQGIFTPTVSCDWTSTPLEGCQEVIPTANSTPLIEVPTPTEIGDTSPDFGAPAGIPLCSETGEVIGLQESFSPLPYGYNGEHHPEAASSTRPKKDTRDRAGRKKANRRLLNVWHS